MIVQIAMLYGCMITPFAFAAANAPMAGKSRTCWKRTNARLAGVLDALRAVGRSYSTAKLGQHGVDVTGRPLRTCPGRKGAGYGEDIAARELYGYPDLCSQSDNMVPTGCRRHLRMGC